MNTKPLFILSLFLILSATLFAQRNEILITHNNKETDVIKAGEQVRLAYPASQLNNVKNKIGLAGIRGKVDSISKEKIWIKTNKRAKTNVGLNIKDIAAIKKTSAGAVLTSLVLTYAVIGGSALIFTEKADLNPAITAFSAVAAIFPASIITANVFYPAKPSKKVGKDYKLDVITVY